MNKNLAIAALLVVLAIAAYLLSQVHAQLKPPTPSVDHRLGTFDITDFNGDYSAELGAGEISVIATDASTILITGSALLAGPGNAADEETLAARSGDIYGHVTLNGSHGTYVHYDPYCALNLEFDQNMLTVSGGDTCDVTIAQFGGGIRYQKVEVEGRNQLTLHQAYERALEKHMAGRSLPRNCFVAYLQDYTDSGSNNVALYVIQQKGESRCGLESPTPVLSGMYNVQLGTGTIEDVTPE